MRIYAAVQKAWPIRTLTLTAFRIKKLVPVEFTYPKDLPPDVRNAADRRDAMCPSCKKGFSNSTKMYCKQIICNFPCHSLISPTVMTSCSHVVCKTCTDTLVTPAKQCVVCDAPTTKDEIIEMKREGERHRLVLFSQT